MAKKNKGLGYNLSDYGDYETSPFSYDDRISEYMNSKVGGNRKYRLQRIAELNESIAMERNYLPENFSVGGFSTGATNPNAHYPLGVALPGWQKGMPNPNLAAQPIAGNKGLAVVNQTGNVIEGEFVEKPNWTYYQDKTKDKWSRLNNKIREESRSFSKTVGGAYQKFQSFNTPTKASIGVAALTGVAAAFLLERQQESDTRINKKVNTF